MLPDLLTRVAKVTMVRYSAPVHVSTKDGRRWLAQPRCWNGYVPHHAPRGLGETPEEAVQALITELAELGVEVPS